MMKKPDQYYLAFLALAPLGLYFIFLALLAIPWIQKQYVDTCISSTKTDKIP
jgi:hypothetical protein